MYCTLTKLKLKTSKQNKTSLLLFNFFYEYAWYLYRKCVCSTQLYYTLTLHSVNYMYTSLHVHKTQVDRAMNLCVPGTVPAPAPSTTKIYNIFFNNRAQSPSRPFM